MNIQEFLDEIYAIDDYAKVLIEPSYYHETMMTITMSYDHELGNHDYLITISHVDLENLTNELQFILTLILIKTPIQFVNPVTGFNVSIVKK
jgi:hypothetical protein